MGAMPRSRHASDSPRDGRGRRATGRRDVTQARKVLVVEDSDTMRMAVRLALSRSDFEVVEVIDGAAALAAVKQERPAVVVLDVELPGKDGFELVTEMRAAGYLQPVLMLTGRDETADRVRGLALGADDYMTKPFQIEELLARVEALLRRQSWNDRRLLVLGAVTVDLGARQAERAGVPLALTRSEFLLLEILAAARGRPVERAVLLREVWGYDDSVHTRTLETHLWRLRKKLGGDAAGGGAIRNVPGFGYMLAEAMGDDPTGGEASASGGEGRE